MSLYVPHPGWNPNSGAVDAAPDASSAFASADGPEQGRRQKQELAVGCLLDCSISGQERLNEAGSQMR
jgi:hypothetical protein